MAEGASAAAAGRKLKAEGSNAEAPDRKAGRVGDEMEVSTVAFGHAVPTLGMAQTSVPAVRTSANDKEEFSEEEFDPEGEQPPGWLQIDWYPEKRTRTSR